MSREGNIQSVEQCLAGSVVRAASPGGSVRPHGQARSWFEWRECYEWKFTANRNPQEASPEGKAAEASSEAGARSSARAFHTGSKATEDRWLAEEVAHETSSVWIAAKSPSSHGTRSSFTRRHPSCLKWIRAISKPCKALSRRAATPDAGRTSGRPKGEEARMNTFSAGHQRPKSEQVGRRRSYRPTIAVGYFSGAYFRHF